VELSVMYGWLLKRLQSFVFPITEVRARPMKTRFSKPNIIESEDPTLMPPKTTAKTVYQV